MQSCWAVSQGLCWLKQPWSMIVQISNWSGKHPPTLISTPLRKESALSFLLEASVLQALNEHLAHFQQLEARYRSTSNSSPSIHRCPGHHYLWLTRSRHFKAFVLGCGKEWTINGRGELLGLSWSYWRSYAASSLQVLSYRSKIQVCFLNISNCQKKRCGKTS